EERWRVATLDATVSGTRLGDPSGEVRLSARGRDVRIEARTLAALDVDGDWRGDRATGRGAVDLRARESHAEPRLPPPIPATPGEQRLTLSGLQIAHEGKVWTAIGTPTFVRHGERVSVDDLTVRAAGGGLLRLRGGLGGGAESDVELVAEALDLDVFAGLVPD